MKKVLKKGLIAVGVFFLLFVLFIVIANLAVSKESYKCEGSFSVNIFDSEKNLVELENILEDTKDISTLFFEIEDYGFPVSLWTDHGYLKYEIPGKTFNVENIKKTGNTYSFVNSTGLFSVLSGHIEFDTNHGVFTGECEKID